MKVKIISKAEMYSTVRLATELRATNYAVQLESYFALSSVDPCGINRRRGSRTKSRGVDSWDRGVECQLRSWLQRNSWRHIWATIRTVCLRTAEHEYSTQERRRVNPMQLTKQSRFICLVSSNSETKTFLNIEWRQCCGSHCTYFS
jgi:hypothetical protein